MLEFTVCDRKYEIPNSISIIDRIPREKTLILNELLQNKKYDVQANVMDDTFKSFLNYLVKDELPEITKSNYWDYYQLSNEFGVLKDYLSHKQFMPFFYANNIINLYENPNIDKRCKENIIAQNLDYYLTNFPNDVKRIQLNSLYNIFNNPEKNLINQDMAYTFIVNTGTQENQSFFVLLETLDAEEMKSEENIIDASIKIKDHLGFFPKNTEKIVQKKIHNLREENSQFKEETNRIKKDLNIAKQRIQNLSREKNQLQEEVNKIKNDLYNAKQTIQNLNKEKSQFHEETNRIKKDLNIAKQRIQNLSSEKKQLLDETNKAKSDLQNEIQKIQNINREKNKLQEDANEIIKNLNIAKQRIQNLSKEKKQLQNEVNKIKNDKKDIDQNFQYLKSLLNSFKQRANQARIPDDEFKCLWNSKFRNYEREEWDEDISQGKEWDNDICNINKEYEYKLSNANDIYDALKKLHYKKKVTKREAFTANLYNLIYKNDHMDAKCIILWTLINDLGNLSIF